MINAIQIVLANLLIAVGTIINLFWLLAAAIALEGELLLPWNAAGVLGYGLIFVATAALFSLPGIIWANRIAKKVVPRWQAFAKVPAKIGTVIIMVAFISASAVLLIYSFKG